MSDIVLSAGIRKNLLSLQSSSELLDRTQNRLSTGKKINSALDGPQSFFVSASLKGRSTDLSRLLDQMGLGVKTLEAATTGLEGLTKLVETMQGLTRQARLSADPTTRATLAGQFDVIRTQIDELAGDSGYNGVNLLNGDNLTVTFNEDSTTSLTVTGVTYDTSAAGLNITAAANAWVANADIDAAITELNAAVSALRAQASTFGANLTIIKARQNFTNGIVLALNTGSDLLVQADQNEEGANLLALQTRQQLGIQALSLANQADQGILRLF